MDVSSFKKTLSRGGKAALSKIGSALSRADELGGEARDAIVEWSETSETAARLRDAVDRAKQRIAALRPEPETAQPETADETIKVADLDEPPSVSDASIDVQIFGQQSCPWTGRAMRLLEDRDIEFSLTDLDEPGGDVLASRLVCETGQNTVPYIFVRGQFVGGFNALSELERLGQLEARLAETNDAAGDPRIKIEVAKRPNTDEVAPGSASRPQDEAPVEPS